jgi:hypothetical protein
MTKFKFTGLEDQDEITFRGVAFAARKAVDVDCDNLAAKLRALPYFEEVKARAPKAPKPAAPQE